MLAAFLVAAPAVVCGGVWSLLRTGRAWQRRDRAAFFGAFRWALLVSSCCAGLIVMELASAAIVRREQRLPNLPTVFAPLPYQPASRVGASSASTTAGQGGATGDSRLRLGPNLYLVVVGESSAEGQPYHPWLSVGQIVGWQLERVFPDRKIEVDVRARGGLCLEQAVLELSDLKRRPDAVIVYSGHNELPRRFGWSREVLHYVEEGPEHPLALIGMVRQASATSKLILDTLDRYRGETPAARVDTRELVDHPSCLPKERAFLLDDYHRRLDHLTAYCRRIGSLPILIIPASNDGAYEPSRSVLSGGVPPEERRRFAREFQAARLAESGNREAAIATYRRLVEQHPEFAESHYRLARLLARSGASAEAQQHFVLARDLDGLPLRCPSDFREAVRSVARCHQAVLIDAPERLARLLPDGILDDHLFHDFQHLNLAGYVALAQGVLEQLHERRSFGWPESTPVPRIDLDECASYFQLDAARWSEVCKRSGDFYKASAYVRYDPTERLEMASRYKRAARELDTGRLRQPTDLLSLRMGISIPRAPSSVQKP
jgi:hypothetical protein